MESRHCSHLPFLFFLRFEINLLSFIIIWRLFWFDDDGGIGHPVVVLKGTLVCVQREKNILFDVFEVIKGLTRNSGGVDCDSVTMGSRVL